VQCHSSSKIVKTNAPCCAPREAQALARHVIELLQRIHSAELVDTRLRTYYEENVDSFRSRTVNPADIRQRNRDIDNLLSRVEPQAKRGLIELTVRQLNDLRDYLAAYDAMGQLRGINISAIGSPGVAADIKRIQDAMLSPAKNAEFPYSSVVIVLYGSLETYVEQLTEQFVTDLSTCVAHYSDIPERLRTNHRRLSDTMADPEGDSSAPRLLQQEHPEASHHDCGLAEDTTFHDLRHTFASTALAGGVPVS